MGEKTIATKLCWKADRRPGTNSRNLNPWPEVRKTKEVTQFTEQNLQRVWD